MTALSIARREMPLDDLVVRVYHMELNECLDEAEFKEGVRLVLRNLDEVLDAADRDMYTCKATQNKKPSVSALGSFVRAITARS